MEETNVPFHSSTTLVLRPQANDGQVVHLKLKKPKKSHKQVSWDAHTVDNEHLNKKKSKCCCIYKKPKQFGEPDTDESNESDNDECASCVGNKKTHQLHKPENNINEPKEDEN